MRLLLAVALIATAACGGATDLRADGPGEVSFERLVQDPEQWSGGEVRVSLAGYLTSADVSVLTSGFAESYPPQPTRPQIWIEAEPPEGACLERAQGTAWAESVVATGRFTYRADGGLGHLGAYEMALENATLACP